MSTGSPSGRSFTTKSTDKTHIFVSIYNDRPKSLSHEGSHGSHESQHSRSSHRWTILVEPHKHRRLSLHHSDPEPILFLISRDHASSSWASHTRHPEPADEENLIGKIHIGESKNVTTVQVEELLRARLLPDGEEWPLDRTSEDWIRAAVHALQEGGVVERFGLDEFMTFARGYVVERQAAVSEDLAPAAIEYAHVAKHATGPVVKKSGHGFWLSWPHSASNVPARSREGSPYGGLM
jgi:hypothetical protein